MNSPVLNSPIVDFLLGQLDTPPSMIIPGQLLTPSTDQESSSSSEDEEASSFGSFAPSQLGNTVQHKLNVSRSMMSVLPSKKRILDSKALSTPQEEYDFGNWNSTPSSLLLGSGPLSFDDAVDQPQLLIGKTDRGQFSSSSGNLMDIPYQVEVLPILEALQYSKRDIEKIELVNTQRYPESSEVCLSPDGQITAATFSQLIIYLTQPNVVNLDFQEEFLLTFQSFTTQQEVLAALMMRFFVNIDCPKANITDQQDRLFVQQRIIRIISKWMTWTAVEFSDTMINAIEEFKQALSKFSNGSWHKIIATTAKRMIQKSPRLGRMIPTDKAPPPEVLRPQGDPKSWILTDIDPNELVRQVTIHHSEIFHNIQSTELLTCIWGEAKSGTSVHIKALADHFNRFASAIMISILQEENLTMRAHRYCYWVDVAVKFYTIGNLHGVFAVMAALTHTCITRLSETIELAMKTMPKDLCHLKQEIEDLCSIDSDYEKYREYIKRPREKCIPFIGCFQKDLIYIQEAFPNKIDNLINFAKCQMCAKLITTVHQFQNCRFEYKPDEVMQQLVVNLPEEASLLVLMKMSRKLEQKNDKKK